MYYSYVEIEYVATSFSPARTDLAVKLVREPSVISVLKKSAPPWLNTFGRSNLKYSMTVEPAFLSRDTSWVVFGKKD
jgi:hypothetical protein